MWTPPKKDKFLTSRDYLAELCGTVAEERTWSRLEETRESPGLTGAVAAGLMRSRRGAICSFLFAVAAMAAVCKEFEVSLRRRW